MYANYGVSAQLGAVLDTLFDGLQRLEYRGYDSAGVCVDAPTASDKAETGPLVIKHQGKIADLRARAAEVFEANGYSRDVALNTHVGIGHTRWATHGPPSATNSHPHVSGANGEFVVVHNGIIANYSSLRAELERHGAVFVSETDTEVVPHLFEHLWRRHAGGGGGGGEGAGQVPTLPQLALEVCSMLEGAYALLIKSARYPDELVACKQGSPLVYGLVKRRGGPQGRTSVLSLNGGGGGGASADGSASGAGAAGVEVWLSSDSAALLAHTRDVVVLEDGDLLHLDSSGLASIYNRSAGPLAPSTSAGDLSGLAVRREGRRVEGELGAVMKGGYDSFMQKEIHEQGKSLADTMRGRVVIGKPMRPVASGVANVIASGRHIEPSASASANASASGGPLSSGLSLSAALTAGGGAEGGFALPGRRAAGGKSAARATGIASSNPDKGATAAVSLSVPASPVAAAATTTAAVGTMTSFDGGHRGHAGSAGGGGHPNAATATATKAAFGQSPADADAAASDAAAAAEPFIRLGGLADFVDGILRCRRLVLVACGTSYHACLAARQTLEEHAAMPVVVELAGDFMDREAPVFRDDTCVFVSQSGETADTLRALEYAKAKGALCVGVTNTVGSAISNATHCGVHLNAGFEIGVASTKAYTAQIVALTMVALLLGADSRAKAPRRAAAIRALSELPAAVERALKLDGAMKELAAQLKDAKDLIFFGRGYNYSTALEAALKVKEVALIHSEGINAGEMKHGPLALVDESLPIVVIATMDSMHRKMASVIQQLLARGGRLIILCNEGDETMGAFESRGCTLVRVPRTVDALQPVVNVVPLQCLSYHLTVMRGFDVDQPRNLAKSVTVCED